MVAVIGWKCDFCGKSGLIVSQAGIMYCPFCNKSYGIQYDIREEAVLKIIDSFEN